MIVGNSPLAYAPLGGEGGPETAPLGEITLAGIAPFEVDDAITGPFATIVFAGIAPSEINNFETVEITLTTLDGNFASELWSTELFGPGPVVIVLDGLVPAPINATAAPLAEITLAGEPGEPAAATDAPLATIALAGFAPEASVLVRVPFARILLSGLLPFEKDADIASTIVVINANTLAVSEYSLTALDVVEHEGEVWFVEIDKLTKLSEDGLENINPYIQTGQLNFGVNNIKYIQNMTVDTPPNASLMITGFIEQPNGDVYMFPTKDAYRDSLNQQTRVFKLPKGIRSTYWGFKFENDGTNTFELEDITLDILDTVLKR